MRGLRPAPDEDAGSGVVVHGAAQGLGDRAQWDIGHAVFHDGRLAEGEAVDVDASGVSFGHTPGRGGEEGEEGEEGEGEEESHVLDLEARGEESGQANRPAPTRERVRYSAVIGTTLTSSLVSTYARRLLSGLRAISASGA